MITRMNFDELEEDNKPKQAKPDSNIAHLIDAMNETVHHGSTHMGSRDYHDDLSKALNEVEVNHEQLQQVIDYFAVSGRYQGLVELKLPVLLTCLMERIPSEDISVDLTEFNILHRLGTGLKNRRIWIAGEPGRCLGFESRDCEFHFDTTGGSAGDSAVRSIFRGKNYGNDIGLFSQHCEFYSDAAISKKISKEQDGSSKYFYKGKPVKNPGKVRLLDELESDEYDASGSDESDEWEYLMGGTDDY